MVMNAEEISALIQSGVPEAQVTMQDMRGDGNHFAALVVSPAFIGKSLIEQHKMVYDALQGRMGDQLHALSLKTAVPDHI